MYLLDREQLHWARLYGDGTNMTEAAGHGYRTPSEVMNQTVFTAALTGTVTPDVGTTVLESLQLLDPEQILHDHAVCYPPADPNYTTALEPLYPDRLAEDFLALTMPGHPADYPAQSWAASTATTLFARDRDLHAPATWTPRGITFLASAAHRWPHLGSSYLYPLLLDDPQLAVAAGNAALTTLADLPEIAPAVLEAIEACLPEHRQVDLDTGIAALATRLADCRLSVAHEPAARARIKNGLGVRLSYAGLHQQALTAVQDAVDLWRRLAQVNPAAFEPDLAQSLKNLGVMLTRIGRREEALTATQDAVTVYRRLAQADLLTADPPAFEYALAISLSNLGAMLAGMGRREEALAATQEAVKTLRPLARINLHSADRRARVIALSGCSRGTMIVILSVGRPCTRHIDWGTVRLRGT
jgi:tetratricopeptide (TPR) repeat protein